MISSSLLRSRFFAMSVIAWHPNKRLRRRLDFTVMTTVFAKGWESIQQTLDCEKSKPRACFDRRKQRKKGTGRERGTRISSWVDLFSLPLTYHQAFIFFPARELRIYKYLHVTFISSMPEAQNVYTFPLECSINSIQHSWTCNLRPLFQDKIKGTFSPPLMSHILTGY